MVSAAEAQKFREAQQGIRVLVDRDLNRLWGQVWSKDADPAHVRDLFLDRVPRLVERYGTDAANLAAQWYEVQREAAGVGGRFAALPSGSPYLDVVEPAVRRTAGALWTPTPADMLTGLTAHTPLWQVLIIFAVFGIGFGTVNAPISTTAVSGMPLDRAGAASL